MMTLLVTCLTIRATAVLCAVCHTSLSVTHTRLFGKRASPGANATVSQPPMAIRINQRSVSGRHRPRQHSFPRRAGNLRWRPRGISVEPLTAITSSGVWSR